MEPGAQQEARRRRVAFLAATGAFALGILYAFREVLAPFAVALVVAYVFAPLVDWMEQRRVAGRRVPRWAAVLTLYVSLLGAMAASIAVGAPLLARELQRLGRETPRMVAAARDEWLPAVDRAVRGLGSSLDAPTDAPLAPEPPLEPETAPHVAHVEVRPRPDGSYEVLLPSSGITVTPTEDGGFVVQAADENVPGSQPDLSVQITEALRRQMQESEQTAGDALRTAQSLVAAVVNGIFKFFIMLMISAYMLITKDGILSFFRTLVSTGRQREFDLLLDRIDKGLSGVVRGQLVICVVNGVLSGIGFYIAGLNYWPVLTLVATVLSIIPIFGAILSSVPAVVVGLQQGVGTALFTLAWIIGIHQVEANLLNPKIMGDAAKVHPVLVVFSLIAGEHFFGILGALLAVPVLSIAQSLFLHFREVALGVPATSTISGLPARADRSGGGAAEAPSSKAATPADEAGPAAPGPTREGNR
jgi:predicted PurR-regulated permease PerM